MLNINEQRIDLDMGAIKDMENSFQELMPKWKLNKVEDRSNNYQVNAKRGSLRIVLTKNNNLIRIAVILVKGNVGRPIHKGENFTSYREAIQNAIDYLNEAMPGVVSGD